MRRRNRRTFRRIPRLTDEQEIVLAIARISDSFSAVTIGAILDADTENLFADDDLFELDYAGLLAA